jgi:kinetochore protein Mis13/DSN1
MVSADMHLALAIAANVCLGLDANSFAALPHSEVDVSDFYKYIEQSLPEPRRMKQLLTWCGSRALPEKPSGDVKNANAIMAARAIQQELIDDFASKPELSDWFSRVWQTKGYQRDSALTSIQEETAPPVVKKPNPQNEKNKTTLEELEEEVKRYGHRTGTSRSALTIMQTRRGKSSLGSPCVVIKVTAAFTDALNKPTNTHTILDRRLAPRPRTSRHTICSPTATTTHPARHPGRRYADF